MDIITSTICSVQDNAPDEDFSVSDIVGGIRLVNGIEVPMSQEEAQARFIEKEVVDNLDEIVDENDEIDENDEVINENKLTIEPHSKIVVKTKITSHSTVKGANRRLTPIDVNKTSSTIEKKISGSHTWTASLTAGISSASVVKAINANLSAHVSYSATRSVTTTVKIKPHEQFYITFTPLYVKVKGKQLVAVHGAQAWKSFSGTFAKVLSDHVDGEIFYITKKI